jgi:putative glutathione S-transferase
VIPRLQTFTSDGGPGPAVYLSSNAAPGLYHLVVPHACPLAHRALIFRKLKCLEDQIGVSVVHPHMLANGWEFKPDEFFNTGPEPLYGLDYMYQLYIKAKPDYTGRVTVPVLWDKQEETIVNNESAEIIRILNGAFNACGASEVDYCPPEYREAIDTINNEVYHNINNGVYRCGFATAQKAYERAYEQLFTSLDKVEGILSRQRYLAGPALTEADWRLFTTLVRFDAVYYGHFKCNRRRIADFEHLSNYLRELYQYPGVAGTVHFDHIKHHYYYSHDTINPTRIVPVGPELDLNAPHNRG